MHRKSGFTLLEILVTVMIITILATIVGVSVARHPAKARVAAAKTQIGMFKTALSLYQMEHSRIPTQGQGLRALCREPSIPPVPEQYPPEGYLDSRKLPSDPWGNEYLYLVPGPDGLTYEIVTYGADAADGGAGEDADISSADL